MITITDEEIKNHFTMNECMKAVRKALIVDKTENNEKPLRSTMDIKGNNGTMLYMPSYSESIGYTSIKIVSVFPENRRHGMDSLQSKILLTDAANGTHLALIDASWLTVMRTGALSGVATDLLAKEVSKNCLLIGCGQQARGQISAILEVRDIERIYLYNPTYKKAEQLTHYIHNELKWNGEVEIVKDPNQVVGEVDIIVCATNSKVPVFDGSKVKEGTHINGIGSFQPSMQEIDLNVLKKSSKIVVDSIEGVLEEAGDFLIPINNNEFSEGEIYGELGDLVVATKTGRAKDDEITFFKSVGFSILDLVVAAEIYNSFKNSY